jgi:hypothetical protein
MFLKALHPNEMLANKKPYIVLEKECPKIHFEPPETSTDQYT